jgi:hypothetical protein
MVEMNFRAMAFDTVSTAPVLCTCAQADSNDYWNKGGVAEAMLEFCDLKTKSITYCTSVYIEKVTLL